MPDLRPGNTDISHLANPARELELAVRDSAPGQTIIYARGWFLSDLRLAAAARKLYNSGTVHLFQRRVPGRDCSKFEYIAVKRAETAEPAR